MMRINCKISSIDSNEYKKIGKLNKEKYIHLREKIIATGRNNKAKEQYYKIIARDILRYRETFMSIMDGPKFKGTPFDLIAEKNEKYVIIELKGSLKTPSFPKNVQLVRMENLLIYLNNKGLQLNPYLLQIQLDKDRYTLFYPKFLYKLFIDTNKTTGKKTPIENIGNWIIDKIAN
jgi:hypothetical protein